MALRIAPNTGAADARPGSNQPADRAHALSKIIADRDAAVKGVPDTAPQSHAAAPTEPKAAPPEPKAQEPDPRHLVELERRDRELDRLRYELQLRDRDLQSKPDGKDWRQLLQAHGHSIEDIVQQWINDDQPGQPKAEPKAPASPDDSYRTRLEQLEARLQREDQERARARRRQEIEQLIPPESEDYEALRALDATSQFHEGVERMESQQKRSLGPQELTQILKDFESQTRKNVESQVERLAKTKFGRNLLTKLLQSSAKTASAQETTEQNSDPTPAQQTYEPTQDRAFRLSRLTSSELREQARKKALDRWRDR